MTGHKYISERGKKSLMKRKTTGNRLIKCLFVMMAVVFAGSSHLVCKADTEKEEVKAQICSFDENEAAPDAVQNIRHTKATAGSYTIAWNASKGAQYYKVLDDDGNLLKTVKGKTSVTIKAKAGTKRNISVVAGRKSAEGQLLESWPKKLYGVETAPGKVRNLGSFQKKNIRWRLDHDSIDISWDRNAKDQVYTDGYKIIIYSVDGKKKLGTYITTKNYLIFHKDAVNNKGFKCKVAGYVEINNKKCYGTWTGFKTVIPEAKSTFTRTGQYEGRLTWTKVDKAVKYTVYICDDPFTSLDDRTYRKLGTVKSNKNRFTVKNLPIRAVVGLYVVPTVKIKGKTYTADKTWYTFVKLR